ncbi:hypothetical protein, partial [Bacillus cereus]|uniref:hypothetical protein n=1 Tax=Bacillus cereus TaxID=1396 RepID=UPI001C54C6EB
VDGCGVVPHRYQLKNFITPQKKCTFSHEDVNSLVLMVFVFLSLIAMERAPLLEQKNRIPLARRILLYTLKL